LGQLVGWYLENSTAGIRAYSVNIAASIAGIWLYTTLCFLSTPPLIWFAFLALGLLVYFWPLARARRSVVFFAAGTIALFALGHAKTQWWYEESWKGSISALNRLKVSKGTTLWSSYSKLTVIPLNQQEETGRYILNTNDTWFQQIFDLSDAAVARNLDLYEGLSAKYHQYNLPYQFYKNPPTVLIAGAGMGNDMAAALRNGAGRVTAVEIDPLIYKTGKDLHFEHPYHSNRVDVHIDDARSFVQNTQDTFDVIVFSILDSHTTSSHYTNIRIDNNVYTLEAIEATRKLLKPNGLFVMSFSSERPWFTKRLHDVVALAFDKKPLTL
jgi:SAM-dependent methyltransferase